MALVPVAMTCGQGTRFTDSFGGCNSYAYTTIGTDAHFRGPKFSIMYRLKLVNGSLTTGSCRVGVADVSGSATRYYLSVVISAGNFEGLAVVDNLTCGFTIVHSLPVEVKTTTEHSIAWTYDQDGQSLLYWDGNLTDSTLAPCDDVSQATAGDIFQIAGATQFDGVEVFDIDRVMFANDVLPAAQILDIHQNCTHF